MQCANDSCLLYVHRAPHPTFSYCVRNERQIVKNFATSYPSHTRQNTILFSSNINSAVDDQYLCDVTTTGIPYPGSWHSKEYLSNADGGETTDSHHKPQPAFSSTASDFIPPPIPVSPMAGRHRLPRLFSSGRSNTDWLVADARRQLLLLLPRSAAVCMDGDVLCLSIRSELLLTNAANLYQATESTPYILLRLLSLTANRAPLAQLLEPVYQLSV